ncbi:MAG5620 family putative phospho-sugar mutase [Mycoplasma simbae]|uniref:MAG5620 family putative phospho-sugar mutase n=1 Tax=Mycoplasma simbae TaxID=36744 RepID=UPI000494FAFC|nr:hypothetical protein [Mycoplasma simbae]
MEQNGLVKDKLILCNHAFVFTNKSDKDPVSLYSFLLLAQAISENIKAKSKILVSMEGFGQGQYISKIARYLQYRNHLVYTYDKHTSVPLMVDEFCVKNYNLDYVIKIVVDTRNKCVKLLILNSKLEYLSLEQYANIEQIYSSNSVFNIDFETMDLIKLDLNRLVNTLTSKEHMLKPFVNIKQRYKSMSLLSHANNFALQIMTKLVTNYNSDFKFRKRKVSLYNLEFLLNIFTKNYRNKEINNVFHFDELNTFSVHFLLKNKYKLMDIHSLALVYLDFYLEEYKRAQIDVSKFKVLIPFDAPNNIKELLLQYHVYYEYFDENTRFSVLNDKSYVFAYSKNGFIANPKYSKQINDYYFMICLVWMLNSYANRNNLFTFKYNKLIENFGSTKTTTTSCKLTNLTIDSITEFIDQFNLNNLAKSGYFIEKINKWDTTLLFLFRIQTDKKHELIFYFDPSANELKITTHLRITYKYKSVYSFTDKFKITLLINKIIKDLKRFIKQKKIK